MRMSKSFGAPALAALLAGALAISVRSELLSLDALEKLAAIDADVVTVVG